MKERTGGRRTKDSNPTDNSKQCLLRGGGFVPKVGPPTPETRVPDWKAGTLPLSYSRKD